MSNDDIDGKNVPQFAILIIVPRRERARFARCTIPTAAVKSAMPSRPSVVALGAEVDTWDPRAERISLLTLHAAKGLEFPVVFVVGCEEGLLPLTWAGGDVDFDEERRLFFVGMTRAGSWLVLTRARQRVWRGRVREPSASRFLRDVPAALLEERRETRRRRGRPMARDSDQLRLL